MADRREEDIGVTGHYKMPFKKKMLSCLSNYTRKHVKSLLTATHTHMHTDIVSLLIALQSRRKQSYNHAGGAEIGLGERKGAWINIYDRNRG